MPIKPAPRRQELLARKETILNNLKYYEKRIREESSSSSNVYIEDSSDSDSELLPQAIPDGLSVGELRAQEQMQQVCMNATSELACLELLQCELTAAVLDNITKGEPVISKPGLWREVTAECRLDLVPFSITFHVHQAAGPFGAKSYRGLKVLVVKKAHDAELARSVLPRVQCPSDAVEVLRNYAAAYRSRRTTLARLADRYDNRLHMELLPEGGCKLRCGFLEVLWCLENRKSSLAPFHHKMIFDVEYMDESYLKVIKQAHKQLSDPTIDTRERTILLAKIIDTCLEAESVQDQNNQEDSIESDKESVKRVEKRRITLESEATGAKKTKNTNQHDDNEENNLDYDENAPGNDTTNEKDSRNSKNDNQIMAPPKSLPKKVKPKGKENMDQNKKPVKRSTVEEDNGSAKKAKIGTGMPKNKAQSDNNQNKLTTDTDKNKNTSDKPQNVNDKVSKTKNCVEKDTVEVSEKIKVLKSKDSEVKKATDSSHNNNKKDKTNELQKKSNAKEALENPQRQANKGAESQKVVENDKIISKTKKSVPEKPKEKVTDSKNGDPKPTKNIEAQKESSKPTASKTLNNKEIPGIAKANAKSTKSNSNQEKMSYQNDQPNAENIAKVASKENVSKAKESNRHLESEKNLKNDQKNRNHEENVTKNTNVSNKVVTKKISPEEKVTKNDENTKTVEKTTGNNIAKQNKITKQKPNTKHDGLFERTSKDDKAKVDSANNARKTITIDKTNSNTVIPNKMVTKNKTQTQKDSTNLEKAKETQKSNKDVQKTNNKQIQKPKISNAFKTNAFDSQKILTSTPKKSSDNKESTLAKRFEKPTKTDKNIASKSKDIPKSIVNPLKPPINKLAQKNPSLKNKLSKIGNTKAASTDIGGNLRSGNSSKESNGSKISKIPKKLGIAEKLRRNSLRISPKKLPSSFKSTLNSSVKEKITNIPRLMKKL